MNDSASNKNSKYKNLTEELVRKKKRNAKEQLDRLRHLVRRQPLNKFLGFLSAILC